ncbi:hypothetical protein LS684_15965 [Cytobacillus spongiae]|uniref:hypothetical protein n=1 Tax=Cytobacillus spongiae TaxID=2901381 RepID=UPI001F459E16|nr:hypothetical protein [Cytobacillus spongiae]UII55139.1 hypothetical protein LS684_15965 [Cytobacillus spongiae]
MSFFQALRGRYENHCETFEDHSDNELKTRYYQVGFSDAFQIIAEILHQDSRATLLDVSEDRGEIAVELRSELKLMLSITVITVRELETAIDFAASTDHVKISGSYPILKKEITQMYSKLDKELTYIGSGLNGNP